MINRSEGRQAEQLRTLQFQRDYYGLSPGRVLITMGKTIVLCTCSIENKVPPFLEGSGKGWLTAEYNMLPNSTSPRKSRERIKPDGRSVEIQRLIGRSMRAIIQLEKLGERTVRIDCDVLQADGGTRTAGINGAFVALVDALWQCQEMLEQMPANLLTDSVAAVSVGLYQDTVLLDLDYDEDKDADVDMNLVMTGQGNLIEVQASGEEATFTLEQMHQFMEMGKLGIQQIAKAQKDALGKQWPLD